MYVNPLRLVEGEIYVVRDGQLERIERDPQDRTSKVRITPTAATALARARRAVTADLHWRPDLSLVASALIEAAAAGDVPAIVRAWLRAQSEESTPPAEASAGTSPPPGR